MAVVLSQQFVCNPDTIGCWDHAKVCTVQVWNKLEIFSRCNLQYIQLLWQLYSELRVHWIHLWLQGNHINLVYSSHVWDSTLQLLVQFFNHLASFTLIVLQNCPFILFESNILTWWLPVDGLANAWLKSGLKKRLLKKGIDMHFKSDLKSFFLGKYSNKLTKWYVIELNIW